MRHLILATLLSPSIAPSGPADTLPALGGALALDNVHIVDAEHGRVSAPVCVRIEGRRLASIAGAGDPACLRAAASQAPAGDDALPDGRTLERSCAKDIAAFTKRADALLTLNRNGEKARPGGARTAVLPDFAPDMRALCGTAEAVERDDPDYRR